MMNMYTYINRSLIVLFWLGMILAFLYFPRMLNFFHSARSINVATFPRLIDVSVLAEFEKATGIKVYVSYYENNDELLIKMRQMGGEDYDLIFPSDYIVQDLIQEKLLKKLEKSKLPFINQLHPRLLGLYYDQNNDYSLPYFWNIYGIGIDKKFFGGTKQKISWADIFDESNIDYRIGMINNAREAILLAAFYLFGTIDNLNASQLEQIKQLLIRQKKWVQVYTDIGPDYLLVSGSCPVAAAMSSDLLQTMRFDPKLDFLVPQEGTFVVIDAIAIPATSKKSELVYQLLNFLYRPDILKHHVDHYALFPPMLVGELATTPEARSFDMLDQLQWVDFFRNVVPSDVLQSIWLTLKAS